MRTLYATEWHPEKKQLIATSRETVQTAEDAREIAVRKIDEDRRARRTPGFERCTGQIAGPGRRAPTVLRRRKHRPMRQARMQVRHKARADMATNQAASAAAINAAQADADQVPPECAVVQNRMSTRQTAKRRPCVRNCQCNSTRSLRRGTAHGDSSSACPMCCSTPGQYSLKPGAREKLAKVAGILIAYPSLNIAVGGYTDNVGGDEMNQKLSENRAGAVRDYLVQSGCSNQSVTATGLRQYSRR